MTAFIWQIQFENQSYFNIQHSFSFSLCTPWCYAKIFREYEKQVNKKLKHYYFLLFWNQARSSMGAIDVSHLFVEKGCSKQNCWQWVTLIGALLANLTIGSIKQWELQFEKENALSKQHCVSGVVFSPYYNLQQLKSAETIVTVIEFLPDFYQFSNTVRICLGVLVWTLRLEKWLKRKISGRSRIIFWAINASRCMWSDSNCESECKNKNPEKFTQGVNIKKKYDESYLKFGITLAGVQTSLFQNAFVQKYPKTIWSRLFWNVIWKVNMENY